MTLLLLAVLAQNPAAGSENQARRSEGRSATRRREAKETRSNRADRTASRRPQSDLRHAYASASGCRRNIRA